MRRSILLVAHISPPSTMSAARRTAGLTRHLRAADVDVTVLTSTVSGRGPIDGAAATARSRDLLVSPLNWRRSNFEALAGETAGTYDSAPSRLASLIVPDLELVGWMPFALPRAVALARRQRFDCIVTTSPPFSAHLLGLTLAASGLPWIADFRDGWTFESSRPPYPAGWQRRLDAALERVVARRADAVVGVTAPITADLVTRYGVRGETITNGFDPLEARDDPDGWTAPLRADRHSLVYTGSLAYGGMSPDALIEGLREFRRSRPALADRLELVMAGSMSAQERAAMDDPALDGTVRALGPLPRAEALALQRAADSLLVLAGDRRTSVATGKLYEYLATGKPILVIGDRTAAAAIVRQQRAGLIVPAGGGPALVDALARLAEGTVPPPSRDPQDFAYPLLARQYAALIDEVIERRSGSVEPAGAC